MGWFGSKKDDGTSEEQNAGSPATASATRDEAKAAIHHSDDTAVAARRPPTFWRKISPLAVFFSLVIVEGILILWGCDIFKALDSRSVENVLMMRISENYVAPYLKR
jgi:hypothetical protein